jgi:hypothetical protein
MLKDAAKELGINYSTAKTIIRIWRLENRIHKKYSSSPKKKKQRSENFKAKFANDELLITTQENLNLLCRKKAKKLIKCKSHFFTIEKNSESTNFKSYSSDVNSNDYSWVIWVLVYYVRMAQISIGEYQVRQNNYIIGSLIPLCESLLSFMNYNVLQLINSDSLKTNYLELLSKILFTFRHI